MSPLREVYGTRDLSYSRWHRPDSISRFVERRLAERLTYIDLDGIEVCAACYEPLCFKETARDVGQSHKATGILLAVARKASTRAALIFYTVDGSGDVVRFRLRELYPERKPERILAAQEYADWLISLRDGHDCRKQAAA